VIVVITEVGGTARLVAKYRPQIPVVAATMFKQTAEQLNLHFGLVPYYLTGNPDNVIADTLGI
jgi:pyruvate kinase